MPKFVTFDDGCGTYNFRAIFPTSSTKTEIKKVVERKLLKNLRSRGLRKDDMPSKEEIAGWLSITGMKEGQFYEPDPYTGNQWND